MAAHPCWCRFCGVCLRDFTMRRWFVCPLCDKVWLTRKVLAGACLLFRYSAGLWLRWERRGTVGFGGRVKECYGVCRWECGTVLPHKAISLSWWLCLRGRDDWTICLALLPGWCGSFWRWGKLEVAYSPSRATHPAMFIPSLDNRAL